jgi:hypothetical protein
MSEDTPMYDYLVNLQGEYTKYREHENRIRQFLERHMDGSIDSIALSDGKVNVATTEQCRGYTYHETYAIPFGYFNSVEEFANNYMKFRD